MRIKIGASYHSVVANGQEIDLSKATEFKGRRGAVKPSREMDRLVSVVVADMQRRGFFRSQNGVVDQKAAV